MDVAFEMALEGEGGGGEGGKLAITWSLPLKVGFQCNMTLVVFITRIQPVE